MSSGFVYTETVEALVLVINVKERTTFADRAGRKLVLLYFAYRLSESLLFHVMTENACTFQSGRRGCSRQCSFLWCLQR